MLQYNVQYYIYYIKQFITFIKKVFMKTQSISNPN